MFVSMKISHLHFVFRMQYQQLIIMQINYAVFSRITVILGKVYKNIILLFLVPVN
jgi:hypothetical protein